jgi:hypothetical protein
MKFGGALVLAASLALLSSLACASESVGDLNENVPGLAGRSWLDLSEQAMPARAKGLARPQNVVRCLIAAVSVPSSR